MSKALLYGSKSLTAEEEFLRAELLEWMQRKMDQRCRPVAIQYALQIAVTVASGERDEGIMRHDGSALYFGRTLGAGGGNVG